MSHFVLWLCCLLFWICILWTKRNTNLWNSGTYTPSAQFWDGGVHSKYSLPFKDYVSFFFVFVYNYCTLIFACHERLPKGRVPLKFVFHNYGYMCMNSLCLNRENELYQLERFVYECFIRDFYSFIEFPFINNIISISWDDKTYLIL